jgi:hypothetical protein
MSGLYIQLLLETKYFKKKNKFFFFSSQGFEEISFNI